MDTNIRISLLVLVLTICHLLKISGQVETDSIFIEEEEYIVDTYNEIQDDTYKVDKIGPINFINGGLQFSLPQTAMRRNHPQLTGGVYANYFRQFKTNSPLFIGGTIGYTLLDNYEDEVERIFDTFTEIWDGSTTSSIVDFSLNLKYFLNFSVGPIEPYMEFISGANWFYTRTTFSFPNSDETDTRYEKGDIVFAYGGALGFMINLDGDLYLDCSVGYFPGLSARYYVEKKEKEPLYNSTIQGFELKKSTTDMLKIKLGVNFAF